MKKAIPYLALALILFTMICQLAAPAGVLAAKRPLVFCDIDGFSVTEVAAKELTSGILPADTEIRRAVYSAVGKSYVVTAVISGSSRSSIHRPELCLPSQGYEMSSPRDLTVGGADWRTLVVSNGHDTGCFAYTFFNDDGYHTISHTARIFRDVLDRTFRGRIGRWTMITVAGTSATDVEFKAFLSALKEVVK